MWVHPNVGVFQNSMIFLQWVILISPLKKTMMLFFYSPNRTFYQWGDFEWFNNVFYQCGAMVTLPLNRLYAIQVETFGQKIGDTLWCYSREYLGCTHFWVHFASPHCLSRIYIPNFVSNPFLQARAWVLIIIHINQFNWLPCITKHKCLHYFTQTCKSHINIIILHL